MPDRDVLYVAEPLSSIRRGWPVADRTFVSPLICGSFKTTAQIYPCLLFIEAVNG
jgi:hypothetical protein